MNKKHIREIAEFFCGPDSGAVPFRIALTFGMSGMDLTKEQLASLLQFLNSREPLTQDRCQQFLRHLE